MADEPNWQQRRQLQQLHQQQQQQLYQINQMQQAAMAAQAPFPPSSPHMANGVVPPAPSFLHSDEGAMTRMVESPVPQGKQDDNSSYDDGGYDDDDDDSQDNDNDDDDEGDDESSDSSDSDEEDEDDEGDDDDNGDDASSSNNSSAMNAMPSPALRGGGSRMDDPICIDDDDSAPGPASASGSPPHPHPQFYGIGQLPPHQRPQPVVSPRPMPPSSHRPTFGVSGVAFGQPVRGGRRKEKSSKDKSKKPRKDLIKYNDLMFNKLIGEGSYGKVFLGNLWGQEVAIKTIKLKGDGITDTAQLKDFRKEIRIMRALRHPNIVEFLGACLETGKLCIITEFLQKGSVEELLDRMQEQGKRMTVKRVLSIAKDVARGLNWLHHKGIIHRDLKTANLLIDENNKVKIADFGLSHMKKRQMNLTGFYGACGTPCYMAPEVLDKKPYDVKADVFSFGIVLCELVVGKYPYENEPESTKGFEDAIVVGLRPEIPDDCLPALADLIKACWQADPARRPTVDHIMNTLRDIDNSQKINYSAVDDLPEEALNVFNQLKDRVSLLQRQNEQKSLQLHEVKAQAQLLGFDLTSERNNREAAVKRALAAEKKVVQLQARQKAARQRAAKMKRKTAAAAAAAAAAQTQTKKRKASRGKASSSKVGGGSGGNRKVRSGKTAGKKGSAGTAGGGGGGKGGSKTPRKKLKVSRTQGQEEAAAPAAPPPPKVVRAGGRAGTRAAAALARARAAGGSENNTNTPVVAIGAVASNGNDDGHSSSSADRTNSRIMTTPTRKSVRKRLTPPNPLKS